MDVKFLIFGGEKRQKVRRFQYTAIDDATRARALRVYEKHTQDQDNAIDFVNHIIEKFPFSLQEIPTDNGHDFQAKFHWYVEDLGIRHAYVKRGTPQLNGSSQGFCIFLLGFEGVLSLLLSATIQMYTLIAEGGHTT